MANPITAMNSFLSSVMLTALTLIFTTNVSAQARLNLFTDCQCNKTLLKQEINYVNHALDPASAQVNLFIVTNYLSNGGKVFNLSFKGQHELEGNQLSFKVPVSAVMTGREVDEELTSRIKLGLAGFLAGTSYAALADVKVDIEEENQDEAEDRTDNWNAWIFEAYARFNTNKESQRGRTDLRMGFEADRTTPELRVRFAPNFFYRSQSVTQTDGSELISLRKDIWANSSVVKSIGDHWSVGFFASGSSSTFRNIDYGIWIAPAIEYNFFNYNEVPFKEFTVAYRVGWTHNDYSEETVFLRTEESLVRQVLDANLRMRQRWGNIFAGLSGGNYLNDFSKNRLSLNGQADVRLIKGLSFNVGGSYQIINDQISLPRGEASVEDILLGQSQLATNFEADLSFGLKYTFGSLYNNVVNTRL
ncbi:hypothetical protein FUA23_04170 [Neolewinella aurantiaca]|uniref:Uncharacterized protein n=1 Tax=Neolewinella aurantiaca TaxID=2602767 RepID=A0A5C7G061_9BACT|nr:hypothetical protein [Neolewinella aurantiaca]TXF91006.1 hypothetical protein FUA23_04170 [Neolewinella aurantiaca]